MYIMESRKGQASLMDRAATKLLVPSGLPFGTPQCRFGRTQGEVTLDVVQNRSGAVDEEGKHNGCRHKTNDHGIVSDGYVAAVLVDVSSCPVRAGSGVNLVCERRGRPRKGGGVGQILGETSS